MSVLLWIALGIIAAFLLLLLFGDMPAYYRNKPASFVEEMGTGFAGVPEGGVMHAKNLRTSQTLTWHKLADPGGDVQHAEFRFTSEEWRSGLVEKVEEALLSAGLDCSIQRDPSLGYHQVLRCPVAGEKLTLAREIRRQLELIIPVVGWSNDDRFTFHVRAGYDPQLDARVNLPFWRYAAATSPYGWHRRMAERRVRLGEMDSKSAQDTSDGPA